tara:strand:+ start:288 stop:449 length:162 start_codon:yes stop_codon:yes gene_type:complete
VEALVDILLPITILAEVTAAAVEGPDTDTPRVTATGLAQSAKATMGAEPQVAQ